MRFIVLAFFAFLIHGNLIAQEILSDSGFKNRAQSQYVYKVLPATDGVNRSNTSFSEKWVIDMFDYAGGNRGYFIDIAKNTSIAKGGIADDHAIGTAYQDGPWEWGYSFYHLPAGNATALPSSFNSAITTKAGAYSNISGWFQNVLNSTWPNRNWLSSISGYYYFNHLGLRAAAQTTQQVDVVGSELAENIPGTSMQMAFARGAARQYGKPLLLDISSWFGGNSGAGLRDYTAFMDNVGDGILKADLAGTRIGALFPDGRLEIKEGSTNSNWTTVFNSVKDFELEGNRIAALLHGGQFYVKEPYTNSNWSLLAESVKKFSMKGSRIAIIQTGGNVVVKEPNTNSNWTNFNGSYQGFAISENRLVMHKANGELVGQNAGLGSALYTLANNVAAYSLTDSYLCYTNSANNLYVVQGNFPAPSILLDTDVKEVKVYANRIVYLKNNGSLWLSVNTGTPVQIGTDVYKFELDGNRIAKTLNTSKELYILTGTNYNYLNTEYTDEGWRFVSENVENVLLEPSNGRLGIHSSDISGKLFVKANPLYLNEPTQTPFWFEGGAAAGHSNSLTKRIQMASYMNGANIVHTEASNVNYFLGPFLDSNGNYLSLSPLGKTGKFFYDFTKKTFPERGIPYQPFALMLPHEHGIGHETWNGTANWVFSYLNPNAADLMNKSLLNAIWPGILNFNDFSEKKFLGNTRWGDLFDVIIQDCNYDIMKEYPVIIVSGDWYPDAQETQKLREYVSNGGNLVINSSQVNFSNSEIGVYGIGNEFTMGISNVSTINDNFTSQTSVGTAVTGGWKGLNPLPTTQVVMRCNNNHDIAAISSKLGNGRIITVAPTFMHNDILWGKLLEVLYQPEIVPFAFSGSAQYAYTFEGDDIWNILIVNNDGVTKMVSTSAFETIDETATRTSYFSYQEKGRCIQSVKDVTNGWNNYAFSDNTISATLQPGEVRVLQVRTVATPLPLELNITTATCLSNGKAKINNYNTAIHYSFSPSGPVVESNGAISNAAYDISYIVTASNAICQESATASFVIEPKLNDLSCICYKPAATGSQTLTADVGITLLDRTNDDANDWLQNKKGGWLALESKSKGFVPNRLTDVQIAAIPPQDLVTGMMVYNLSRDCLFINTDGTVTGWKCFDTQTCPD